MTATETRSSLDRLADRLESRALYIAAVAAVAIVSLARIYLHISQDTYLALVAGRLIARSGIPHHDYLTVMAHGVRWVDQQWLSQLVLYELDRIGGLGLVSVVYVALTTAALGGAVAVAVRLGATERPLVMVLPIGAFFYVVTAVSIRTQGLAYPLFVLVLWLLTTEARTGPTRRVYAVFPILIVWANLHGSVTLGIAMAMIFGAVELRASVNARGRRGMLEPRGLSFVLISPLTLLMTPYGLGVIRYYHATLLNSEFSKLVTEWRPVTSVMLLGVPYLLMLLGIVWVLGRSGRRTPAFDHFVLLMLGFGGVLAVRNITWFGLASVMLAGPPLGHALRERPLAPRRRSLNIALAGTSIAVALLAALSVIAEPAGWFERTYDKRAIQRVASLVQANPRLLVFADVRYADWLIWHDPKLAGHLAYDTSFELLTAKQLESLSSIGTERLPGQHDLLAPYGVFVLDPKNKSGNRHFLDRRGVRTILRNKRVVIATQPTG